MAPTEKILIVDDDTAIANLLREVLEADGYITRVCHNGIDAVNLCKDEDFQLVLLDIMMPLMNGFETCQEIRRFSDVPIVFLTAKDDESDTVVGFSIGADDYIVKPFKPRELMARIKARIRRSRARTDGSAPEDEKVFDKGGLLIDSSRHRSSLHDVDIKLTPKEFQILELLSRECGKPVPIKDIFETVWKEPYNSFDSNTIMVHIRRIRKKMAQIDSSREFIETIFGVGYRLTVNEIDGLSKKDSTDDGQA